MDGLIVDHPLVGNVFDGSGGAEGDFPCIFWRFMICGEFPIEAGFVILAPDLDVPNALISIPYAPRSFSIGLSISFLMLSAIDNAAEVSIFNADASFALKSFGARSFTANS